METTIIVRDRLSAYAAAKACYIRHLSTDEGRQMAFFRIDPAWGWSDLDIIEEALEHGMALRRSGRTECVIRA